jgi:ABC-2 type transport system permease protein
MMLLILAQLAAAFAISSALRLRSEETSGRLEALLATGLSRTRWLLGSLAVTIAGAAVLLFLTGLGMGLAYGLVISDASQPLRLASQTLLYTPAVAVLVGLAVLLVGWVPRGIGVAWGVFGYFFVLAWLGGLIDLPRWANELSPYWHTPAIPLEPVTLSAPLMIAVLALFLVGIGAVGFRRRDVG